MSAFTEAEREYLQTQPLMRFSTASLKGKPDVATVIFEIDGDTIVVWFSNGAASADAETQVGPQVERRLREVK